MKIILLSTIIATALLSANESKYEYEFVQSTIPNTKISKYKKSIVDGFYDVFLENGQILYINPYKELIFFGEIMNKNGYNFTAANRTQWQEELNDKATKNTTTDKLVKDSRKVDFNKGSQNEYSFVLFTDPECPYCQVAEKYFSKNDTTVYFNFTPLPFHKNAPEWSKIILSSKDFKAALDDVHRGNIPNTKITKDATVQLEKMQSLAKELNVTGTPKIYVINLKKQEIVEVIKGADIKKLEKYIKGSKDDEKK